MLAAHSPGKPVTTNFMGLFRSVDQFRWAAELDVVSVDSYPDPADAEAHLLSAMACDLTRSVGGGRPWLLMEQAPSAVNWRAVNVPKAPGQYRALSLQAVARGADAVLSFQWRAAATGAEKFHSGMVPHAGTDSRVWREVTEPRRGPAAGSRRWPAARCAPRPRCCSTGRAGGRSSSTRIRAGCASPICSASSTGRCSQAGVTADFAHPESDLSGYRLVLVPALYLVSDAGADNVRRFVADGGTVLITLLLRDRGPARPGAPRRLPGALA